MWRWWKTVVVMVAPICDLLLAAPAASAPNQRHSPPASAPSIAPGNCRGNIPSQNGNPLLPFLAAFAARNTQHHVADPHQPASIPASPIALPRHKVKTGKNGNVD